MQTKVCRKCNEEKQVDAFSLHRANRDGLRNECKACMQAYKRQYYSTHAYPKQKRNAQKQKEYNKKWQASNPDKVTAYRRAYRKSRRTFTRPSRNGSGFVYVFSCSGYFKIGSAVDVTTRLKITQTHNPLPVTIVHTIHTDNMEALERKLHHHFATKRGLGEWFELDASDVAYLLSL